MSKCAFAIEFSGSAETLIGKAVNAIGNAGGDFTGDANEGSFHLSTPIGSVKGTYRIENSNIHIQIDQKPLLVSCNKIEEELRKRLK